MVSPQSSRHVRHSMHADVRHRPRADGGPHCCRDPAGPRRLADAQFESGRGRAAGDSRVRHRSAWRRWRRCGNEHGSSTRRAGIFSEIPLVHRPQDDRHAVFVHGNGDGHDRRLFRVRLPHAAGVSQSVRSRVRDRYAGQVQRARHHARQHHDFLGGHAGAHRRIWKFSDSADGRLRRYGVSANQSPFLSDFPVERPRSSLFFFGKGRPVWRRLDRLSSALRQRRL